jgi:uncharacterized protein (TIGR02466 family)
VADRISNFYPTSVLHRSLPGMEETNRQLAALIREMEKSDPNFVAGTTTEGGFQTSPELFKRDHPALNTLKGHIRSAVQTYAQMLVAQECAVKPARMELGLWGWAVILRAGGGQGIHIHPYANVSGVYYVEAPPALLEGGSEAGRICFHDPRPRANMNQLPRQITRQSAAPVPGDLVLFPSWLEHSVPTFRGAGERICIAFNAALITG